MYVGVDTHKRTHVLVAIDEDGRTRGSRTVAHTPEERVALLGEFARRYGPQRAGRLPIGLPNDRQPTEEEVPRAATKTTIVRFTLTN